MLHRVTERTQSMTFKTFFTVYAEHRTYEPVESFTKQDGTYRVQYYPNEDVVHGELVRIDPTTTYIPVENIKEIEAHEHRM